MLLKRGLSATIDELLLAAEYILDRGNPNVMLCERGIRTFEDHTRFTLPLATVPYLHEKTHLPVVVDPSHGTGKAKLVSPMARAAVAAGADGLIIEVHPDPEHAVSDGAQTITPAAFGQMMACAGGSPRPSIGRSEAGGRIRGGEADWSAQNDPCGEDQGRRDPEDNEEPAEPIDPVRGATLSGPWRSASPRRRAPKCRGR